MNRRIPTLLLLLLLPVGCSDRATNSDSSGPKWPEASVDISAGDQGVPDLPRLDLPLPDAAKPDVPSSDVTSPDVLPPDLLPPDLPPPDLPPPPTWKAAKSGTTEDLHAVACQSYHVFAAGAKGIILHSGPTAPAGGAFAKQSSNIASDLYTVTFAIDGKGKTYGAAAGNNSYIMQTTDWGTTWGVAPQCSAFIFETFYSLHLTALDKGLGAGVAVTKQGGGMKYYTGYSWVCTAPTYKNEVMHDTFSLGSSGWTVGDTAGKIYYTVDDGWTWKTVTVSTKETLRGVHFAGAKLGLAVGAKGTILTATDGKGLTWKAATSPSTADLWDVFFWDTSNGWIVGDKGTILHTADGGKTWAAQKTGSTTRLEGVCFTSATNGWAVGQKGTVLYTTSGGK